MSLKDTIRKIVTSRKILIIGLLLLAFFLRVYKVDQVPASLYYDEIDLAYQAKSLIANWRDYRGVQSPFFVRSFNSDRTPLPAYATVPTTLLFKNPFLQVRMPFVILGTIIVGLVFALVDFWTGNFWMSLLVGAVFATSPWQIQFSRFSHEATVLMTIYLLSFWFLFKWLKSHRQRFYWLWVIFLSLGVYTYRTMSLFVPLTFVFVGIIFYKDLLSLGFRRIAGGIVLAGLIVCPFLYATTIASADQPRIAQISITADPLVPIWVARNREVDSGDYTNQYLGKKATFWSSVFHSKPVSWLDSFFNNYFKSFSTEFLFTQGDPNMRQSVGKIGELLALDVIAIFFGLWWMIKNIGKKYNQLLLTWLLLSPIPSDLTMDGGYHASRLFLESTPLLVIVGIGWWSLFVFLKRVKLGKLMGLGVGLVWLGLFGFYLHHYYVHYPIDSARDFGYGFEQAILDITSLQDKYDKVYMADSKDPPIMYYLYWANINPKDVQAYGTTFEIGKDFGKPLDKIKAFNWERDTKGKTFADRLEPRVLYLVSKDELRLDLRGKDSVPAGVKLIDLIKYPDNEVAFYLVAAGDQSSLTKP